MASCNIHPASFRDPSGFVFERSGQYYRQVNNVYKQDYDLLMSSGLYNELVASKSLLPHEEINFVVADEVSCYKTLLPQQINLLSYPYEWSFAQLKDAALLTLRLAKTAIRYGMMLKDASAYNVQFGKGPVFIDTLSFERYNEKIPWVAYRQFCTNFLFPLLIEHYTRTPVHRVFAGYPDGVPVNAAASWLPFSSRFSMAVWLHVFLQKKVGGRRGNQPPGEFSKTKMENLLSHLEQTVQRLNAAGSSEWTGYYEEMDTSANYLQQKEKVVDELLAGEPAGLVLDAGCNSGYFSKLLAKKGFKVIAIDSDAASIGDLYESVKKQEAGTILPLVCDIASPSASSGFRGKERMSFHERFQFDLVIALALVHHLAISKNIPLYLIARYFADISPTLLIEWIPREDEKVMQMLSTRNQVFSDYNIDVFEREFGKYFQLVRKAKSGGSGRFIYLMKRTQI